ncbi:MAG: hypothetical protein JKY46_11390 [Robiginitomaculum sp.]|nr:hypothetical protein [Robiginitomaculum sp.]
MFLVLKSQFNKNHRHLLTFALRQKPLPLAFFGQNIIIGVIIKVEKPLTVRSKSVGFIFKAGFWFGVVLLFLPKNPDTLQDQRQIAQDSARSLIEVANSVVKICDSQPDICKTASETSKLATTYINLASDSLNKANKETDNQK